MSQIVEYQINQNNWSDVCSQIISTELLGACPQNVCIDGIIKLYFEYIEEYKAIPAISDIVDEVNFFNMNVYTEIAQIQLEFNSDVKYAFDVMWENRKDFMDSHYTEAEAYSEVQEELIQTMIGDFCQETTMNGQDIDEDFIASVLVQEGLPFFLNYQHEVYSKLKIGSYMEDYNKVILVNSAHIPLFPEWGNAVMKGFGLEDAVSFYSYEEQVLFESIRNYTVVTYDLSDKVISDAIGDSSQMLEFKGWAR